MAGFFLLGAQPAFATDEVLTLSGHEHSVTAIAFSPNGKTLASASWDQTARLWDVATGKLLGTLKGHNKPVLSLAFSPDGKTLATGSLDFTIVLWSPSTGAQHKVLNGHKKQVNSLAFSPDGNLLASASHDSTVRLWDGRGMVVRQITVDGSQLSALAFSPDGAVLVVAGHKGLTAWNVADGTAVGGVGDWQLGNKSVAFSSDGRHVAAGATSDWSASAL
jgi:WD40 repeat protein